MSPSVRPRFWARLVIYKLTYIQWQLVKIFFFCGGAQYECTFFFRCQTLSNQLHEKDQVQYIVYLWLFFMVRAKLFLLMLFL